MKKRKIILCLAICSAIICTCIAIFFIKFIISFEVYRKIIIQYEDDYEYDTPSFNVITVELMKERCDKSNDENLIRLGELLKTVDSEHYDILIIRGGKLESFTMRLDHSFNKPYVKYSKGNHKNHVEYYLIKTTNRYIDQERQ